MKHLSVRLFAPFSCIQMIIDRAAHFSVRKINMVTTMPQRMVGKWRLYLNYCPECNSCAPKLHRCEVCNSDTKSYFHWNEEVSKTWWKKYTEKHRIMA